MYFRKQKKLCIANVSSKVCINYHSALQNDVSRIYLKEVFGDNVEFSNDAGAFDLNVYPNQTKFEVLSYSATYNSRQPSTPQTSQNVPTSQAVSGRRFVLPLATVKVVKVDLGVIGMFITRMKYVSATYRREYKRKREINRCYLLRQIN